MKKCLSCKSSRLLSETFLTCVIKKEQVETEQICNEYKKRIAKKVPSVLKSKEEIYEILDNNYYYLTIDKNNECYVHRAYPSVKDGDEKYTSRNVKMFIKVVPNSENKNWENSMIDLRDCLENDERLL